MSESPSPDTPPAPSAIDQVLAHNEGFARTFNGAELIAPPARKLMVIACMDARINLERALGLHYGDAHILRNAGGIVTPDVLRSAIVSTNVLGTREIMVINHTGCGMMGCSDAGLSEQLTERYGPSQQGPTAFHGFTELDSHVREQAHTLAEHPWIPPDTVIRSFIYDVQTGMLHEVDRG